MGEMADALQDFDEMNNEMGEEEIYCPECGGCGYIGCDGIKSFLETHVKGKTNCLNEAIFIDEIIEYFET